MEVYKNSDSYKLGVSFLELVVAILLLSIVASYIAFTIPLTASHSLATDNLESSSALAYRYMENIKDKFKDNPEYFETVTEDSELPTSLTSGITYDTTKFSVNTLVEQTTETTDSVENTAITLVTVKVTVSPTNTKSTSSPETVSITTKIYKEED